MKYDSISWKQFQFLCRNQTIILYLNILVLLIFLQYVCENLSKDQEILFCF